MPTTLPVPENRVTLTSVSWEQYLAILGEGEHDGRMAYFQGVLEIITLGSEHESIKQLISHLLWFYEFYTETGIRSVGSFTMKREELQSGIEADDCYYIESIDRVRDFDQISFPEDPPPDLAIEVDITNPTINKLAIYAALGVPEIWRYRDGELGVLLLRGDGCYSTSATSACLPGFPIAGFKEALKNRRADFSSKQLLADFAKRIG